MVEPMRLIRAKRQGLADAQVVQQSAEALFGRGLDTIVDVQLARRATAQAQYDLAQANTAQHDAMYTLLAAMDLPPTTKLRVADASERPLPQRTARTVDDVLSEAMAMVGSCCISGISGALVPLALKRFGADPATASSIIVTTATDVSSMGLMLALATMFIH